MPRRMPSDNGCLFLAAVPRASAFCTLCHAKGIGAQPVGARTHDLHGASVHASSPGRASRKRWRRIAPSSAAAAGNHARPAVADRSGGRARFRRPRSSAPGRRESPLQRRRGAHCSSGRLGVRAFAYPENDGNRPESAATAGEQATEGRDRHSLFTPPLGHRRNCRCLRNSW